MKVCSIQKNREHAFYILKNKREQRCFIHRRAGSKGIVYTGEQEQKCFIYRRTGSKVISYIGEQGAKVFYIQENRGKYVFIQENRKLSYFKHRRAGIKGIS